MATYYVGPGGNDANDGLSWANRFLTLNGAEDEPVAADDTVYVGPGVYRETLNLDVSGGAVTPITYIGDVTGEHTDGIGGVVRVTGSNNDQTRVRAACVLFGWPGKNYRIFRGFRFDMASNLAIDISGQATGWIFEDCVFTDNAIAGIGTAGDNQADGIVRRCLFIGSGQFGISFWDDDTIQDAEHLVENCIFTGFGHWQSSISITREDACTIRNCLFIGAYRAIQVTVALVTGTIVNNCAFSNCQYGLVGQAVGDIIENFNSFFNNGTDRTNTNTGAQSNIFPMLIDLPVLHSGTGQISGYELPWWFGELSEWSPIRAITGTNEPGEDLRGLIRPATAAKNSWGAIQFMDMERDTGTVRTGAASMVLLDAGINQMFVPITAVPTTIEVYVHREADYAGNNPQLIVKQPGQADDVTTDAAAASQWNLLTTTLTPAADPPYVIIELVSRNTAAAGAYSTFFDDLDVT